MLPSSNGQPHYYESPRFSPDSHNDTAQNARAMSFTGVPALSPTTQKSECSWFVKCRTCKAKGRPSLDQQFHPSTQPSGTDSSPSAWQFFAEGLCTLQIPLISRSIVVYPLMTCGFTSSVFVTFGEYLDRALSRTETGQKQRCFVANFAPQRAFFSRIPHIARICNKCGGTVSTGDASCGNYGMLVSQLALELAALCMNTTWITWILWCWCLHPDMNLQVSLCHQVLGLWFWLWKQIWRCQFGDWPQ